MNNKLINNQYSLKESSFSDLDTYQNSGYLLQDSSFLFAVNNRDTINVIEGKLDNTTEMLFNLLKDNHEREKIYVTAIKNLIKQKNYLNLIYELSNDLIDEEEFNDELENNESQYLINVAQNLNSTNKLKNLINVLNNIDENFNEEDLMEVFSISDAFIFKNIMISNNRNIFLDDRSDKVCP